MYLVFAGTTDHLARLKKFLGTIDHTLLEGTSSWQGWPLAAQVIIVFDKDKALQIRDFLTVHCRQKEVPIHHVPTIQI
jgi:hypothetical protein